MSFTSGGTYRWMSPELLDPEAFGIPQSEESTRPTTQSDCYALGTVIYEVGVHANKLVANGLVGYPQVLCGHHPYNDVVSDTLVIDAIVRGARPKKPKGAARLGFTNDLWRILERCWLGNRSARPSVEEIIPYLSDAVLHWYTRTVASDLSETQASTIARSQSGAQAHHLCKVSDIFFVGITLCSSSDLSRSIVSGDQSGEKEAKSTYIVVPRARCSRKVVLRQTFQAVSKLWPRRRFRPKPAPFLRELEGIGTNMALINFIQSSLPRLL